MAEKKKWSPLDGDRPEEGTPEGEEYATRHITPGPERERELARRKKKREEKEPKEEGHEPEMDSAEDHQQYLAGKEDAKKAKQQKLPLTGEKNPPKKPKEPTADELAGLGQGRWQKRNLKGESTNNKFDSRLEAVYKSLMSEDATDTAAETTEKQAAAISAAHAKKSLARKAMDALTGNQDGDIADTYDELQTAKKTNLLPALKDELAAVQALGK